MQMSSRRSKSIVTCGQSRREAGGAVWGFTTERYFDTFVFSLVQIINTGSMPGYESAKQFSIRLLHRCLAVVQAECVTVRFIQS